MLKRRKRPRIDPSVAEAFAWLTDAGFELVEADWGGMFATFATGDVLVRTGYHWKDGYATLGIARRRASDPREQPHWSYVELEDILAPRAPGVTWNSTPPDDRDVSDVFRSGSDFLRTHAADLVAGENLDLLDQIVERRPRIEVPGLDFPTSDPWFASAEGVWFFTDAEMPRPMSAYLDRSRSDDPVERAVAALKMPVVGRGERGADVERGHARLHELLRDPVVDVRRAAASALGEWQDRDALDELLGLLDEEEAKSPIAAAVAFIALDRPKAERDRVLEALSRFGARSPSAAAQVEELRWRLDDGKRCGYRRRIDLSGIG